MSISIERPCKALALTTVVHEWLATSREPRILHVFDRACNLINEHREVLSVVVPQIGEGPFNLVVNMEGPFSNDLSVESPVSVVESSLLLGELCVDLTDAVLWDPHPDWEMLHSKRDLVLGHLSWLPRAAYRSQSGLSTLFANTHRGSSTGALLQSLVSSLSSALTKADSAAARDIASKLAGLGAGLTPAGDDVLLGAMYAAWILHPFEIANALACEIAMTAAPLTSSLSAAWLRAAGRGEAGARWHEFFDALLSGDRRQISIALETIVQIGETSGADALAGFWGTMMGLEDS